MPRQYGVGSFKPQSNHFKMNIACYIDCTAFLLLNPKSKSAQYRHLDSLFKRQQPQIDKNRILVDDKIQIYAVKHLVFK